MKDYLKRQFSLKYAVFSASLVLVIPQIAISSENKAESIIDKLYNCAKLADNNERLTCYDANILKLQEGEKSKEIVILDKVEVKAAKKAAFGFSMPKIKIFEEDSNDAKGVTLDIEITNIQNRGAKPLIITSEGQEWQVLDESEVEIFTDPPYKAKIKSATLGSYLLHIEGRNKSYRVKRVK